LNKAEELGIIALEKQRQILGEDHPHTLICAATLAMTYHNLGRLNEAEELEVVVLEKQMNIFGKDHQDTFYTMALLAAIHYQMGQSNKVGIMNFIRQKLFVMFQYTTNRHTRWLQVEPRYLPHVSRDWGPPDTVLVSSPHRKWVQHDPRCSWRTTSPGGWFSAALPAQCVQHILDMY
jgi:hypothetical protein